WRKAKASFMDSPPARHHRARPSRRADVEHIDPATITGILTGRCFDNAGILVGELVVNAVRHAGGRVSANLLARDGLSVLRQLAEAGCAVVIATHSKHVESNCDSWSKHADREFTCVVQAAEAELYAPMPGNGSSRGAAHRPSSGPTCSPLATRYRP